MNYAINLPAILSDVDSTLKRALALHILTLFFLVNCPISYACCCICSFLSGGNQMWDQRVFVIMILMLTTPRLVEGRHHLDNLRCDVNNQDSGARVHVHTEFLLEAYDSCSVIFGRKWEQALRMGRSWNTQTGYMRGVLQLAAGHWLRRTAWDWRRALSGGSGSAEVVSCGMR